MVIFSLGIHPGLGWATLQTQGLHGFIGVFVGSVLNTCIYLVFKSDSASECGRCGFDYSTSEAAAGKSLAAHLCISGVSTYSLATDVYIPKTAIEDFI